MPAMKLFSTPQLNPASDSGWRKRWFDIIHRHDTPASRRFDIALVLAILASVLVIMIDSVQAIHARFSGWLYGVEWFFTVLFTAEYVLRLKVVRRPLRYAFSVWGIIDLLSILPAYLSLFIPGAQALLAVRILRVLRLFRILKLTRYVDEGGVLIGALWRSRRKIILFLFTVLTITVVAGALMYVIEGPEHGFHSIPGSMYWAIVTMATVGYGDMVPHTSIGRFITSVLILIGYSILAVPTGIYTAELAGDIIRQQARSRRRDDRGCTICGHEGHDYEASHCNRCGHALPQHFSH